VCFSPQADLVGGTVIAAIGIDAVRHVGKRRDHLLLAALPLLLGFHQIVEAFVWWGQQGHVPPGLAEVALWVYLLIAFVVLPIYVPLAVLALEPTGRHRRLMIPSSFSGQRLASHCWPPWCAAHRREGPAVPPRLQPAHRRHVAADLALRGGRLRCPAALGLSRRGHLRAVNLFAIIVIAALTVDGFASVWCGWAAITSGAIALHMRFSKPHAGAPFAFG